MHVRAHPPPAAPDPDALERGRESFGRQAWADAYAQLSEADRRRPLDPEDLERLAMAAHLLGRDAESTVFWLRAHDAFVRGGEAPRAVRCIFRVVIPSLLKGEMARGGGWIARAQRLLDDGGHHGVERGYLTYMCALRTILQGDAASASAAFGEALGIGERFGDRDLVTYARQGQGRALIRLGEIARGVALLDEVMAAVTGGEVNPAIAGDVYCSVIEGCDEIFDLRRAREWTEALSDWCASREELVPYRGQCLVHRAEILRLHGAWRDALDEARRASGWPAAGSAFYEIAEIHRLRGEFAEAEEAYRQASRRGREPQPGWAQLRLAQGRFVEARAAILRAAGEARERRARARTLAACVEITLACGDAAAARTAAEELSRISVELDAPLLRALSAEATGAVLLAEGDFGGALAALRDAGAGWQTLEAPYDGARVRVLVGIACRGLGDADAADMELETARQVFQKLGAAPDLARLRGVSHEPPKHAPLSTREIEVLGHLVTGKTNRAIAVRLEISEKTVARHVSNIFAKLGVSTRSAATAYAYEHGFARSRG